MNTNIHIDMSINIHIDVYVCDFYWVKVARLCTLHDDNDDDVLYTKGKGLKLILSKIENL